MRACRKFTSILNRVLSMRIEDGGSGDSESSSLIRAGGSLSIINSSSGNSSAKVHSPPVLLFGFDLTRRSERAQFVVLFGCLLVFMGCFSVFQEIVVYEWFQRELGVFTAALHFLGCILCALPFELMAATANANSRDSHSTSAGNAKCMTNVLNMFSHRAPLSRLLVLSVLKSVTQTCSNLSMQYINFPTKMLFKSALPIATMLLGLLWGRRYSTVEYAAVCTLTAGIVLFMTGRELAFPEGSLPGFAYVTISLLSAALTPIWQEHLASTYRSTVGELLVFSYLGSFGLCASLSAVLGQTGRGIALMLASSSWFYWACLLGFSTFGYLGANCSVGITLRFGALTNGICNSSRKIVTVLVSILAFPGRNGVDGVQVLGLAVFVLGLVMRTYGKQRSASSSSSSSGPVAAAMEAWNSRTIDE